MDPKYPQSPRRLVDVLPTVNRFQAAAGRRFFVPMGHTLAANEGDRYEGWNDNEPGLFGEPSTHDGRVALWDGCRKAVLPGC